MFNTSHIHIKFLKQIQITKASMKLIEGNNMYKKNINCIGIYVKL